MEDKPLSSNNEYIYTNTKAKVNQFNESLDIDFSNPDIYNGGIASDYTTLGDDWLNKYAKYNVNPILGGNWDFQRALNQGGGEQTINAIGQMAGDIVGMTMQGIGAIGEIPDFIADLSSGRPADMTNSLMEAGSQLQESNRLANPIYRENPNESLDFGDPGWWAQSSVSLASTLGLLIPGMGAAKLVGKVGTFGKTLARANRAKNVANAIKVGGNVRSAAQLGNIEKALTLGNKTKEWRDAIVSGIAMRNAENMMEAGHVTQQVRDEFLNRYMNDGDFREYLKTTQGKKVAETLNSKGTPLTKENVAKYIAGESALRSYQVNSANVAFDIAQMMPFFKIGKAKVNRGFSETTNEVINAHRKSMSKGAMTTTDAITRKMARGATSVIGADVITEGIEEMVNYIGGAEGLYYGQTLMNTDILGDDSDFSKRMTNYLHDPAAWESALLGAFGGLAFGGVTKGINAYKAKKSGYTLDNSKDRVNEIEARSVKLAGLEASLQSLNRGINPFTNEKITSDGELNTLRKTLVNNTIRDMAIHASRVGNVNQLKEFLRSGTMSELMNKINSKTKEESGSTETEGAYYDTETGTMTGDPNSPFSLIAKELGVDENTLAQGLGYTQEELDKQDYDKMLFDIDMQLKKEQGKPDSFLSQILGYDTTSKVERSLKRVKRKLKNVDKKVDRNKNVTTPIDDVQSNQETVPVNEDIMDIDNIEKLVDDTVKLYKRTHSAISGNLNNQKILDAIASDIMSYEQNIQTHEDLYNDGISSFNTSINSIKSNTEYLNANSETLDNMYESIYGDIKKGHTREVNKQLQESILDINNAVAAGKLTESEATKRIKLLEENKDTQLKDFDKAINSVTELSDEQKDRILNGKSNSFNMAKRKLTVSEVEETGLRNALAAKLQSKLLVDEVQELYTEAYAKKEDRFIKSQAIRIKDDIRNKIKNVKNADELIKVADEIYRRYNFNPPPYLKELIDNLIDGKRKAFNLNKTNDEILAKGKAKYEDKVKKEEEERNKVKDAGKEEIKEFISRKRSVKGLTKGLVDFLSTLDGNVNSVKRDGYIEALNDKLKDLNIDNVNAITIWNDAVKETNAQIEENPVNQNTDEFIKTLMSDYSTKIFNTLSSTETKKFTDGLTNALISYLNDVRDVETLETLLNDILFAYMVRTDRNSMQQIVSVPEVIQASILKAISTSIPSNFKMDANTLYNSIENKVKRDVLENNKIIDKRKRQQRASEYGFEVPQVPSDTKEPVFKGVDFKEPTVNEVKEDGGIIKEPVIKEPTIAPIPEAKGLSKNPNEDMVSINSIDEVSPMNTLSDIEGRTMFRSIFDTLPQKEQDKITKYKVKRSNNIKGLFVDTLGITYTELSDFLISPDDIQTIINDNFKVTNDKGERVELDVDTKKALLGIVFLSTPSISYNLTHSDFNTILSENTTEIEGAYYSQNSNPNFNEKINQLNKDFDVHNSTNTESNLQLYSALKHHILNRFDSTFETRGKTVTTIKDANLLHYIDVYKEVSEYNVNNIYVNENLYNTFTNEINTILSKYNIEGLKTQSDLLNFDFTTIDDKTKAKELVNELLEYIPLQFGQPNDYKGVRISPLKYKNDSAMFIKGYMDVFVRLAQTKRLTVANLIFMFETMKEELGQDLVNELNIADFSIADVIQGSNNYEEVYKKVNNWYENNINSFRSTATVYKIIEEQLLKGNKLNNLSTGFKININDRGLNKLPLGEYNKVSDVFTKSELDTIRYISNIDATGIETIQFKKKDGSIYTYEPGYALTQGFYIMVEDTISGEPLVVKLQNGRVGDNDFVKNKVKDSLIDLLSKSSTSNTDTIVEAQNEFADTISPYIIRTFSGQGNKLGFTTYTTNSNTPRGDKGTIIHLIGTKSNANVNSWGAGQIDNQRYEFSIRYDKGKYILTAVDRNGSDVNYRDINIFDNIDSLLNDKVFNNILDSLEIHPDTNVNQREDYEEADLINEYVERGLFRTDIQPINDTEGNRVTISNINPYNPNTSMLDFVVDTNKPRLNGVDVNVSNDFSGDNILPDSEKIEKRSKSVIDLFEEEEQLADDNSSTSFSWLKSTNLSDFVGLMENSHLFSKVEIKDKLSELRDSGKEMTVGELLKYLYADSDISNSIVSKLNPALLTTIVSFSSPMGVSNETAVTVVTFDKEGNVIKQSIHITDNFMDIISTLNDVSTNKFLDIILGHELIHVGLNNKGKDKARNELRDIQTYLADNKTEIESKLEKYGIKKSEFRAVVEAKNASELITYGLTDSRFTKLFNEIASPRDNNKSIWQRLKDMILSIIDIKVNDKSILSNVLDVVVVNDIVTNNATPLGGERDGYLPTVDGTSNKNDTKSPVKEASTKKIEKTVTDTSAKPEQLTIDFEEPIKSETDKKIEDIKLEQNTDYKEDDFDFAVYAESSIVC